MKINELNVSDWVLYKGKPVKIIDLNEDGITIVKTIEESFCSGYTQEMLNDMKPLTAKCKDCNWFSDFFCKWRLQIARINSKPDSVANRNKNDSYCKDFIPSYNFIQKYR